MRKATSRNVLHIQARAGFCRTSKTSRPTHLQQIGREPVVSESVHMFYVMMVLWCAHHSASH